MTSIEQSDLIEDPLDSVRNGLLEAIFQAKAADSYKKISLVKKLFNEITAAKSAGLDFDQIAEVIEANGGGVSISASTLRTYYFQIKGNIALKSENEIEKILKTHEQRLSNIRDKESVAMARTYSQLMVQKREKKIFSTEPGGEKNKKGGNVPVGLEHHQQSTNDRDVKEAEKIPSNSLCEFDGGADMGVGPYPRMNSYDENQPLNHISQIERLSSVTNEFPTLEKNLVLVNDLVFDADNEAWAKALSPRNILILKTSKKLIAPSSGRTSNDFVPMKSVL